MATAKTEADSGPATDRLELLRRLQSMSGDQVYGLYKAELLGLFHGFWESVDGWASRNGFDVEVSPFVKFSPVLPEDSDGLIQIRRHLVRDR